MLQGQWGVIGRAAVPQHLGWYISWETELFNHSQGVKQDDMLTRCYARGTGTTAVKGVILASLPALFMSLSLQPQELSRRFHCHQYLCQSYSASKLWYLEGSIITYGDSDTRYSATTPTNLPSARSFLFTIISKSTVRCYKWRSLYSCCTRAFSKLEPVPGCAPFQPQSSIK